MKILFALTIILWADFIIEEGKRSKICMRIRRYAFACIGDHGRNRAHNPTYRARLKSPKTWVGHFVHSKMPFDRNAPAWWTSGHGDLTKEDWVWTPGNTPVVDGWHSGEPNNNTGRSEQCVALKNGELYGFVCHDRRPFICESTVLFA
ncbi:hypothetical protein CAPTEDRAFT_192405 [Capitella teleta]|uniref:C-type lectin domain-containing protein n=1 Tax=Capitella teleta TaxID=283909 RepID=R7VK52_CAPTE|nr:hypothetical protein CAPTEDRAFT_192405 [Capitella teleta]|eukprot:ELU16485.1 hypothetical protein CAPTEDRAFT_192405 [Capitella teleta]